MCGKHDDPSMIDAWVREVTAEEAYAMKFYGNVGGHKSIELHTREADEYMEYIGDGCDYDCYTRTLLVYPYTTTHIHTWWNHKSLWDEQSEKYAEALHGANEMRRNAYAKVVEPEGWWESRTFDVEIDAQRFTSFEEAVEYYR